EMSDGIGNLLQNQADLRGITLEIRLVQIFFQRFGELLGILAHGALKLFQLHQPVLVIQCSPCLKKFSLQGYDLFNLLHSSPLPLLSHQPFKKPSIIFASASSSVSPKVQSFKICSPAIFPMAASWIS